LLNAFEYQCDVLDATGASRIIPRTRMRPER
jgi:hypothetical protein